MTTRNEKRGPMSVSMPARHMRDGKVLATDLPDDVQKRVNDVADAWRVYRLTGDKTALVELGILNPDDE